MDDLRLPDIRAQFKNGKLNGFEVAKNECEKITKENSELKFYYESQESNFNEIQNKFNEQENIIQELKTQLENTTNQINNLRNSLFQKTISHTDAKNIYSKLKMKLISLVEDTYTLKKAISTDENNENNKNNEENKNNETNLKDFEMNTIKEENENSQMISERE